MPQFESDGQTIAYDEFGGPDAKRRIVLVHGFSSNKAEGWKRMGWYDAFATKGFRGVALDARGHGQSAKPHDAAAYDRRRMAHDIVALMDHVGFARANLLGFSMGSHLSLTAGLLWPERFGDLILGGIGGKLLEDSPRDDSMAEAMEAEDPATIADPMRRSFRQFADEQGEDRLALAACSRGEHFPIDRAALGKLDLATLVVAGSHDELAGNPRTLAQVIPGAKAVSIPGCDHFSIIAHPLFKASVFDFLEGFLD